MFAIEDKRVKSGDQCILWRGGPGGGVVAIGEVAKVRAARLETLEPEAALGKQIRARPDRHILEFATLLLASPLSPGVLEATGLGQVAKQARAQGKGGTVVPLALSVEQFQRMVQLADEAKPPSGWPTAWNITPGSVVARRKLHEIYGGNARVPAGSSARTPNAFLFLSTRRRGDLAPRWNGSTLFAPGHGQHAGDLSQENLAILTHVRRGVPLRVFLTKGSECLYLGEFFADPNGRWSSGRLQGSETEEFTVISTLSGIYRLRSSGSDS